MVKVIFQMNGRCDGCRIVTVAVISPVIGATSPFHTGYYQRNSVQGIVIQIRSCNDFHFFKFATVIRCRESQNSIIASIDGIVFPTTFERRKLRFRTPSTVNLAVTSDAFRQLQPRNYWHLNTPHNHHTWCELLLHHPFVT